MLLVVSLNVNPFFALQASIPTIHFGMELSTVSMVIDSDATF